MRTCKRLCYAHQIRLDIKVFMGPQLAGAPHTALHLIKDQQRAGVVAELAQALQKVCCGWRDTAFALHGLNKHCAGLAFLDDLRC
jgi:hypothetical protein